MPEQINWTTVITQAYWPLFSLFIVLFLRGAIIKVLTKRKITISLPNNVGAVDISDEDAGQTLTSLFTEFYLTYNKLTKPWHKQLLAKIVSTETKLHVIELIPDYDSDNDEHRGALRALRGLGLIEPKFGGKWQRESIIEVTPFGRLFIDRLEMNRKSAS